MRLRLPHTFMLLALLLAACSGERTRTGATEAGAWSGASTSGEPTPGSSLPAAGTPSAAAADGSEPVPAAPADARTAALAPKPGVYTYRQDGRFSTMQETQDAPDSGTLTIDRATAAGDGARQLHTRRITKDDTSRFTYLFTTSRILLERAEVNGMTCRLSPPLELLEFPVRTGDRWKSASSCSGMNVSFTVEANVARSERRRIGGVSVDTFVIISTTKVDAGPFSQTQDATTWFAPDYRLAVRSEERTTSSFGTANMTEELTSPTPRRI